MSSSEVASALGMYYRGMSIDDIRNHLNEQYQTYLSTSTVYEWITRFTGEAIHKLKNEIPNVGDKWIADETVLDIGGHKVWFWDIIDAKTRFLLASHMSYSRTVQDAKTLVEQAAKRANKTPSVIYTDSLRAYIDGIELAFGSDTKHIQSKPFVNAQESTNIIERFQGTIKERTKVMRGLKSPESAKLILDGYLVYYNFFRPHESLDNKTPAEVSRIHSDLKNWIDVVTKSREYVAPEPIAEPVVITGIPSYFNKNQYPKKYKPPHKPRRTLRYTGRPSASIVISPRIK